METMKAADTEYEKHSLRNIFTIEKKIDSGSTQQSCINYCCNVF